MVALSAAMLGGLTDDSVRARVVEGLFERLKDVDDKVRSFDSGTVGS